jgi:hypothetical protein
MKKLLLPLLFLALVIQSCKKDTPPKADPDSTDANYVVSRVTINERRNSTQVQELSYDEKNRLKEIKYKEDIKRLIWDTYEFTYDEMDRLIKAEWYNGYGALQHVDTYKYTSDSTPKDGYIGVDAKGQITSINAGYIVIYDFKGHILYYGADIWYTPGLDYHLSYDDKNNPFKNIIGVNSYFNNQMHTFPAITVNNILNNFSGGVWSFEYNKADYPTKASFTDETGFEHTIQYEYIVK